MEGGETYISSDLGVKSPLQPLDPIRLVTPIISPIVCAYDWSKRLSVVLGSL